MSSWAKHRRLDPTPGVEDPHAGAQSVERDQDGFQRPLRPSVKRPPLGPFLLLNNKPASASNGTASRGGGWTQVGPREGRRW